MKGERIPVGPPRSPCEPPLAELSEKAKRLALGAALGLAIGASASWLRVLLAGSFRIDTARASFVISSLVLGLGLALASVCSLRLIDLASSLRRSSLLRSAIPVQLAAALAVPLTSSDFFQYLAYGLLQLHGKNPLAVGPDALGQGPLVGLVAQRWISQPSVYGPVLDLLFLVSAWVGALFGAPLLGTAIALKLLMLSSGLATTALAARFLCAHQPGPTGSRALAMVAFSPLLAWEIAGQGHVDGVMALSMMLFVWAATERREMAATLWLSLGALAKLSFAPILALYLLFLLRSRGPRVAALCGSAAAAMGALLMLPYLRGFVGLTPVLNVARGTHSHSLGDLLALAVTALGPAAQDSAVRATFILCIVCCTVAFGTTALFAKTLRQLLRGSLVFLLAWDMTVPLFQPWYIVWLYPLAIADHEPGWHRLVCLYGIWSVLQWAVQLDPLTTVAIDAWVVWTAARLLRKGWTAHIEAVSP
jgi:hypothetical protein